MRLTELGYISNLLSLTRVLLALPIFFFLQENSPAASYKAVALMFLAALTDALDGWLARRLNQKSDLGRILDPVADKICVGLIAIMLVQMREMPLWFVAFVILRDLVILVLGLFLSVRTNKVVESNTLGKITVCVLALTLVVYTLNWRAVQPFFLAASVAFIIASSISYILKLVRQARGNTVSSGAATHREPTVL